MIIKRFEDLEVYQLSLSLQRVVFELTKLFPKEERYSLVDQIRRSSRSVGANIAEAWHKRPYPAHFASKLTDADADLWGNPPLASNRSGLRIHHGCGV